MIRYFYANKNINLYFRRLLDGGVPAWPERRRDSVADEGHEELRSAFATPRILNNLFDFFFKNMSDIKLSVFWP